MIRRKTYEGFIVELVTVSDDDVNDYNRQNMQ